MFKEFSKNRDQEAKYFFREVWKFFSKIMLLAIVKKLYFDFQKIVQSMYVNFSCFKIKPH